MNYDERGLTTRVMLMSVLWFPVRSIEQDHNSTNKLGYQVRHSSERVDAGRVTDLLTSDVIHRNLLVSESRQLKRSFSPPF